jgi:hypothetical protein
MEHRKLIEVVRFMEPNHELPLVSIWGWGRCAGVWLTALSILGAGDLFAATEYSLYNAMLTFTLSSSGPQQMERFKVMERQAKTKAFSKEGLAAAAMVDPREKERNRIREWLNDSVNSLNMQIEGYVP